MTDTDCIVPALSGPAGTLSDGTLRLQIAVAPEVSQRAFKLFGAPNTEVAMTVLGKHDAEAIVGYSGRMQVMAKGVMRLFVDVQPGKDAALAFAAFGKPDTLMALAALKPEHLRQREAEKQQRLEARGLRPAYLAVQWCRDMDFRIWLWDAPELADSRAAVRSAGISAGEATLPLEEFAALVLCHACGIKSRRELDTDADARSRFDRNVRRPYLEWQQRQTQQGANP